MAEKSRISARKPSGIFFYARRVPKEVSHLDHRGIVRQSLKTRDRHEAIVKSREVDRALEAHWGALLQGKKPSDAWSKYERAVTIARGYGFTYRPVSSFTQDDIEEVVRRVQAAYAVADHEETVDALLGGVPEPEITLSGLVTAYLKHKSVDLQGKSAAQRKRHTGQRELAVGYAIKVMGDLPLAKIKRTDTLKLRQWWAGRIERGEVTREAANKSLSDIKGMLRVVDLALSTEYGLPWEKLRFSISKKSTIRKRLPFPIEWVQDKILAPGALDGLNLEARMLVYLMVETGARPAELCNLRPEDIRLSAKVPHIAIQEREDREQKTRHSIRTIPLVGVSLWAAKQAPNGFPRYQDKSDSLSATVNKFFVENGLKPTPDHVLYSLRHTFQDRILAAHAPDRLQADLMGHELGRPVYGEGASLEHKVKLLESIKFRWGVQ